MPEIMKIYPKFLKLFLKYCWSLFPKRWYMWIWQTCMVGMREQVD